MIEALGFQYSLPTLTDNDSNRIMASSALVMPRA